VRRPVWFVAKVSPKKQDNTDGGCSHLSRTVLFLPCRQQTVKLCTMPTDTLLRKLTLLHGFRNPLQGLAFATNVCHCACCSVL